MKTRRVLSIVVALAICVALCTGFSFACDNSAFRASPTLSEYNAKVSAGYASGDVIVSFDVEANVEGESVGVSSIKIYTTSSGYVTTIRGTAYNGLIGANTALHRSSYTYHGLSGVSYYAEVTVFATIDGVTDSRTITTNTVQAP